MSRSAALDEVWPWGGGHPSAVALELEAGTHAVSRNGLSTETAIVLLAAELPGRGKENTL